MSWLFIFSVGFNVFRVTIVTPLFKKVCVSVATHTAYMDRAFFAVPGVAEIWTAPVAWLEQILSLGFEVGFHIVCLWNYKLLYWFAFENSHTIFRGKPIGFSIRRLSAPSRNIWDCNATERKPAKSVTDSHIVSAVDQPINSSTTWGSQLQR